MKKVFLILAILTCGLIVKSQYPTEVQVKISEGDWLLIVPTSITLMDSTNIAHGNMYYEFQIWAPQLNEITSEDDVSYYEITPDWNPTNGQLNEIEGAGGNTENWPLYLTVNDSTFFTEEILGTLGGDSRAVLGRWTEPLKEWGNYLPEDHEIYFYEAPTPDQYIVLAAKENGDIMTLETVRDIVSGYSQCVGYRTALVVSGISTKVHRDDW